MLLLLAGFLGCALPIFSHAETIILYAIGDSGMLDEDDRNNPFPGIIYSELDTVSSGNIWLSVLKFDLSSLAGKTINSATLELTSYFNHNNSFFFHEVFSSSDDSWTEETVTGVNRPLDSTLSLLDSTAINGDSKAYTWDVTAGISGADGFAGTNNVLTFLIRPELSQAGNAFGPHFNDRDSTSGVPRLIINASSSACSTIGTVSANLDISIPFINYQSADGIHNLWADLQYVGINSEGKHIWSLKEFDYNSAQCSTVGIVSENLDIYIPAINYQSADGTHNLWAELQYLGINSEGKHIWGLRDYSVNQ